ncbi:hypothetical protein A4X06_0g9496 [Tilletia controversa]|uniref:Uncharacterized protein n=1 Tax=Tilletia controversa TaxID=13291 RepID=A0A8X7MIF1_9BASI|nr:hypothetical protein A4X06_0g9496 [Tilletia controversa]
METFRTVQVPSYCILLLDCPAFGHSPSPSPVDLHTSLIRRAAPPRSCALEATTSTPEGGHSAIPCACAPPGGWYLCASTRRTSPKTDLKAHRPSLAASSAAPVGDSSHTHLPPPFPHDEPYFALLADRTDHSFSAVSKL